MPSRKANDILDPIMIADTFHKVDGINIKNGNINLGGFDPEINHTSGTTYFFDKGTSTKNKLLNLVNITIDLLNPVTVMT